MNPDETIETPEGKEDMITKEKAAEGTANTLNGSSVTSTCIPTLPNETEDNKRQSFLEAALSYAQRGWPVFPIWEIEANGCACGKTECPNPGKHPRTSHGLKDATTDRDLIKAWWTQWPEANISIATGEESGLLVLDVDPRHGGNKSFQDLEETYGSLPHTIEALSGGGGRHFYFAYPQGRTISDSAGLLGAGLDVRATSIIAPPSRHVSGGEYVWKAGQEPGKTPLAELPDWLLDRLQQKTTHSVSEISEGKIKEGQRNETLFHAACCLRGRGLNQEEIESTLQWVNVQHCEPPLEEAEIQSIAARAARYAINTQGEENEWVEQMNAQYAVVRVVGKTLILIETFDPMLNQKDIALSSPADLNQWYKNQQILKNGKQENVANLWLEHPNRRQYQGIVFSPKHEVSGYYNLWQGFAVEPKEGDCSRYLEHIKNNIAQGDEMINRYVLAWMAQCIQEPDKRPGVAIVLRGKQGTGKGVFATQFGKLFGKHFVHVQHQKHLLGHFNAQLKDALVVFADEAFWAGDKASEGALKAMVTEEQFPIEFKGKDAFPVQNHIHLLVASNHDWVVPSGLEERRFCVLDINDQHMQDHQYFESLVQQMNQGGREALLHILLNYDLTGVNLREFPQTQALMENKLLSMSPVEKFWYERLMEGSTRKGESCWETYVLRQEVHQDYYDFASGTGQSRRSCETELGRGLKKLIPGLQDATRTISGNRGHYWIFPDLKTCRDHFNQITKWGHPWPEEGV